MGATGGPTGGQAGGQTGEQVVGFNLNDPKIQKQHEDLKKKKGVPEFQAALDMLQTKPIEHVETVLYDDPDLFDQIADGRKAVADRLYAYASGPMSAPLLVRTTPGLGKTEAGIQIAIYWAKKGLRVFYAVPTRNMALQISQRIKDGAFGLGVKVINLEGRHDGYTGVVKNHKTGLLDEIPIDPNCYYFDRVQKASARGYYPGKAVCPSCPFYVHYKNSSGEKVGFKGACRYYQTVYRAAGFVGGQNHQEHDGSHWAPIIMMTHQKLASLMAESDGESPIKPDVIIVDEDWSTALRDTVAWSEAELVRPIKGDLAIVNFRKLLVTGVKIANKYKHQADCPCGPDAQKDKAPNAKLLRDSMTASKLHGCYVLWGRQLVPFLREAASQMGVSLGEVLDAASVADTGVGTGDYMNMSDAKDALVPHYKEPELAQELRAVLDQDTGGKQSCYRTSLRFSEKSGWEYYWDSVRRLNWGGPVVFLDAYGDPEIVKRLCNEREPEVVTVKAKARKNVHVHQYLCSTSRMALEENEGFDKVFDKYVDPILRSLAGKNVLFYALKRFTEPLRQRVKEGRYGLAKSAYKWFWQDRGDDSYKDHDAQVILGTPFSNIVAERHFANAIFYGEEPLDWSRDKKGKYIDPRVRKHLQARQEKEMQQVCYRLRPASDAKDQVQHIHVISKMDLDVQQVFPGATTSVHKYPPHLSNKKVSDALHVLRKYFNGWTPLFSAFVGIEQRVIAWFDAGGVTSGREFPVKYGDLIERFKQWVGSDLHRGFKGVLKMVLGDFGKVLYNGKEVEVAGDVARVLWVLEQIRLATREPGVDDEPLDPSDVQYNPMEDMDDLSVQAINMALAQVANAEDAGAVAAAGNTIYAKLVSEQAASPAQAKKAEKKAPTLKLVPKTPVSKTDDELYLVASDVITAEFEDKGWTHFLGTMKFYMAVDALQEELIAERDIGEMFSKPSGGEEPPPLEEDDHDGDEPTDYPSDESGD